ncbi:MAG TPA: hypothetical protein VK904_02175 [Miltoncostaeaceae bacterium]|nr:hypothetical protein [Miltoncostaeaceae bacterium]
MTRLVLEDELLDAQTWARTLYHARSFGWLDARLRPSEPHLAIQ